MSARVVDPTQPIMGTAVLAHLEPTQDPEVKVITAAKPAERLQPTRGTVTADPLSSLSAAAAVECGSLPRLLSAAATSAQGFCTEADALEHECPTEEAPTLRSADPPRTPGNSRPASPLVTKDPFHTRVVNIHHECDEDRARFARKKRMQQAIQEETPSEAGTAASSEKPVQQQKPERAQQEQQKPPS